MHPTRQGEGLGALLIGETTSMALEIGWHAEYRDPAENEAALDALLGKEKQWRKRLGAEAEAAPFYGADEWRRVSEAWIEPDLDDEELAFEIAGRLTDYMTSLEPHRRR